MKKISKMTTISNVFFNDITECGHFKNIANWLKRKEIHRTPFSRYFQPKNDLLNTPYQICSFAIISIQDLYS